MYRKESLLLLIFNWLLCYGYYNNEPGYANIQIYDQHKYAVTNISMETILNQDYYAKNFMVKVKFNYPRNYRELGNHFPGYNLFYRVWKASLYSPALFHSEGYIDKHSNKMEFTLDNIDGEQTYFVRIFTITDLITETLSSLKFFSVLPPNHFHAYQGSYNQIKTYDNEYAPHVQLNLENYYDHYSLRVTVYNHAIQKSVKALKVDLEKNYAIINSTSWRVKDTVSISYTIPYGRNDEYVLRVFSVLNNDKLASEYSISKFFVLP